MLKRQKPVSVERLIQKLQILEKLLALNLERAAEEADEAKVKKTKPSRSKHADELI